MPTVVSNSSALKYGPGLRATAPTAWNLFSDALPLLSAGVGGLFDNSNRLPCIHYLLKPTLHPEIPSLVESLLSTDCQKAHGFYCEYWSSESLTYCGWASEIAKSPVDRWFIHVYPIIHRLLTIENWCNKNRWPIHIIHRIGPRSAGVLYVCWPLLQWRPVSRL